MQLFFYTNKIDKMYTFTVIYSICNLSRLKIYSEPFYFFDEEFHVGLCQSWVLQYQSEEIWHISQRLIRNQHRSRSYHALLDHRRNLHPISFEIKWIENKMARNIDSNKNKYEMVVLLKIISTSHTLCSAWSSSRPVKCLFDGGT